MISSLELAKLCGVSQGTVDRALHGRAGISPATRTRILEAAHAHGYAPNPGVKELMNRTSSIVGAVVPAQGGAFTTDLLNAVRAALGQERLRLWVDLAATEEEFLTATAEFAARRCLGLVLIPPHDRFPLPENLPGGIPAVSLLSRVAGADVTLVTPDEVETGRQAVRFLWGKNHRRILHLTYARDSVAILDRARGYEQALRELGGTPITLRGADEQAVLRAVREFRPTALFCHNDWLALTASRALRGAGLRVPEDLSILGVDNSATFTALCPDFTTLSYPLTDIAARVRDLLLRRKQHTRIGPYTLIERATVRTL